MSLCTERTLIVFLLAAGLAPGCADSSSSTGTFNVMPTTLGVSATTPVAIAERRIAFLADEATTGMAGMDLNGDADMVDSVATVVDAVTGIETSLGVAASRLEWASDELFLIVNEATDGTDWDGDMAMTSLVILNWNTALMDPRFVATLAAGSDVLSVGNRLFYESAVTPAGAFMSNLSYVDENAPTVPVSVSTTDATAELTLTIHGEDEGLLFLLADEAVETRDLNGDADQGDGAVLLLLDGTDAAGVVRSTELALAAGAPTVRADAASTTDWVVAFLVDEAAQGATNLNDPMLFAMSWEPSQCSGPDDADATDRVLHYIQWNDWNLDPVTTPAVNTGLVGADRVLVLGTSGTAGHVATISDEADSGNCDLNGDGDMADRIFRHIEVASQVLPTTSMNNLHALANLPGGTIGAAELQGRFVIIVSEAADGRDLNSDPGNDFDLVGWVAPGALNAEVPFVFDHSQNMSGFEFGATWMQERDDRERLYIAIPEDVEPTSSIRNSDADTLDSLPAYARFVSSPTRLVFAGTRQAVVANNAGLVETDTIGFARVSEASDSVDWNGDGDMTDTVLVRTPLGAGQTVFLSEVANAPRPVVEGGNGDNNPLAVSFLRDENDEAADLNGDGDMSDRVLSFFRVR